MNALQKGDRVAVTVDRGKTFYEAEFIKTVKNPLTEHEYHEVKVFLPDRELLDCFVNVFPIDKVTNPSEKIYHAGEKIKKLIDALLYNTTGLDSLLISAIKEAKDDVDQFMKKQEDLESMIGILKKEAKHERKQRQESEDLFIKNFMDADLGKALRAFFKEYDQAHISTDRELNSGSKKDIVLRSEDDLLNWCRAREEQIDSSKS